MVENKGAYWTLLGCSPEGFNMQDYKCHHHRVGVRHMLLSCVDIPAVAGSSYRSPLFCLMGACDLLCDNACQCVVKKAGDTLMPLTRGQWLAVRSTVLQYGADTDGDGAVTISRS